MSNTVLHKFVSTRADGPDSSLVRPSSWNSEHSLPGTVSQDGYKLVADSTQTDKANLVHPETCNLTNQTGGTHVVGDVVALSTANDASVVLDDTLASQRIFVVALQTNATAATGMYARAGVVTGVKAQGAIARGQYVRKSATTKAVEDSGTAYSTTAMPPVGTVGLALNAAAAGVVTVLWFGYTQAVPATSADFVKGLQMRRHASTATKVTFESADKLVMVDANDTVFVTKNPATFDVDTATSGPAAGGRDQAGAFSNGALVHVYAIRSGATIAGTWSLTAPSAGGPALPTGYTHWTYLSSYVLNAGTTNVPLHRLRGARVFPETAVNVLASGGATTETAVSVATAVPANALAYRVHIESVFGTVNGSGQFVDTLVLRVISGSNIRAITAQWQGLSAAGEQIGVAAGEHEFPNVSQQFFYLHSVTQGSAPQTTIDVQSYTVPNGGS